MSEKRSPDESDDQQLNLGDFQQPPLDAGLSLDELSSAFAEMLHSGDDPYEEAKSNDVEPSIDSNSTNTEEALTEPKVHAIVDSDQREAPCEITPRSIVEALFFVGLSGNEPITSERLANLMRGVREVEVDEIIRDLNNDYRSNGCPYHIISDNAGYRLVLRDEFFGIRDKFHGKMKEARLSQAAVDILAIVAYNQPMTAEDVTRLRGTSSSPILSQLVRRELLKVRRPDEKPRTPQYSTTDRFLELFSLDSLKDLPIPQDLDKR